MRSGTRIPVLLGLFALYVLLRALAWSNTYLFEDHDSILYLQQIEAYLTFDPAVIHRLSPDSTPFYPFIGALASLPGWSVETGARLASLLFSMLLFVAAAGILRGVATPLAGALSLAVLAVSPYLITFSISILSEPAYVAVIYLGLWYFLARHARDSLKDAAILGVIFGLSFLNRLEGLLFLPLIPAFHGIYLFIRRQPAADAVARTVRWSLVYVVTFVIVSAPQVLIVSDKMDRFALNGRGVWAEIQLSPAPGSYDEKIYGLDYSPTEINLTYLQRNPVEIEQPSAGSRIAFSAENILRNLDKFYAIQIGKLGGSLLVALFLFGLLELYRNGRRYEAMILLLFAGAVLVPGIVTDPKPRAVGAIVPAFVLLAGPGMCFVARELGSLTDRLPLDRIMPALLLSVLGLLWIVPFLGIYVKERRENVEYSLVDLEPFRQVVMRDHASGNVVMTARKQYLSHLSGVDFVPLPFTNYDGLIRYSRANDVDLIFLEHRQIGEYPFMRRVSAGSDLGELSLVYEAQDSSGQRMGLYQLD